MFSGGRNHCQIHLKPLGFVTEDHIVHLAKPGVEVCQDRFTLRLGVDDLRRRSGFPLPGCLQLLAAPAGKEHGIFIAGQQLQRLLKLLQGLLIALLIKPGVPQPEVPHRVLALRSGKQ